MGYKHSREDDGAKMTESSGESEHEAILHYLRRHPEFLARHPDLLSGMLPPSRFDAPSVVDMQAFMVTRLKDQMERLRTSAEDIIATTRSNLSSQMRTHAAVLALIEANNLDQVMRALAEDVPMRLDVDAVIVGVEGALVPPSPATVRLKYGTVANLLGPREVVLKSDIAGDELIYGGAAPLVRSEALSKLSIGGAPGLLAIGARQPDAFQPGQGTELLIFLARVIEIVLGRHFGS